MAGHGVSVQKNAGRPLRKSDAGRAQLAAPGARLVVFVTQSKLQCRNKVAPTRGSFSALSQR